MKNIIGNPPYSVGQVLENDNNKNIKYPKLDKRIQETYAKHSTATNKNSLYDSYKRAIRLATDDLQKSGGGVVSFVTNASFLNSNTDDGLRKSLVKEYDSIYIFNLRGNKRTIGELAKKEGGPIFEKGSRLPICIFSLVMKGSFEKIKKEDAKIFYYEIDEYLTTKEKLSMVKNFGSFLKLPVEEITPNKYADWLNKRDDGVYETYQIMGNKKGKEKSIFNNYTGGIKTCRDAWVYNFSKAQLEKNVKSTIDFYNFEVDRLTSEFSEVNVDDFVNNDATKISWDMVLKKKFKRGEKLSFK